MEVEITQQPEKVWDLETEMPVVTQDKLLVIDGQFVAREKIELPLKWLNCLYLGSDAFTEVYLVTSSGNIYRLMRSRRSGEWMLTNGRTGLKITLTEEELDMVILKTGEFACFRVNESYARTTSVTRIIAIAGNRQYVQGASCLQGHEPCDIRQRFQKLLDS